MMNIAVLPVVAILPRKWTLRRYMFRHVKRTKVVPQSKFAFKRVKLTPRKCFLLQTAVMQAWTFHVLDVCLVIALTLYLTEYPLMLLVWSMSALAHELAQISSQTMATVGMVDIGGQLLTQLRQYYTFDPFNVLDIPALTLTVLAVVLTITNKGGDVRTELAAELDDAPAPLTSEWLTSQDVAPYLEQASNVIKAQLSSWFDSSAGRLDQLDRSQSWDENVAAVALLLMWIRQLRLLPLISPEDMAPLVLMVLAMMGDVVKVAPPATRMQAPGLFFLPSGQGLDAVALLAGHLV